VSWLPQSGCARFFCSVAEIAAADEDFGEEERDYYWKSQGSALWRMETVWPVWGPPARGGFERAMGSRWKGGGGDEMAGLMRSFGISAGSSSAAANSRCSRIFRNPRALIIKVAESLMETRGRGTTSQDRVRVGLE